MSGRSPNENSHNPGKNFGFKLAQLWMTKPGVDSTVSATSWPQIKANPQPKWEGPKHVHSYGLKYHL